MDVDIKCKRYSLVSKCLDTKSAYRRSITPNRDTKHDHPANLTDSSTPSSKPLSNHPSPYETPPKPTTPSEYSPYSHDSSPYPTVHPMFPTVIVTSISIGRGRKDRRFDRRVLAGRRDGSDWHGGERRSESRIESGEGYRCC